MLSFTTENSIHLVGQINNSVTGSKTGAGTAAVVSTQGFMPSLQQRDELLMLMFCLLKGK